MALRGASADALATAGTTLDGALANADAAQVGTDLAAVSQVLRTEAGLRRVATDVSVPAAAKSGLVHQVFGGKVSDAALAVVDAAVTQRWTAGRDLADALEHLSVVSVVKSAGEADSGRLADELFGFAQVVKDNPELRDALADPARSVADKSTLVESLLGGKALPATVTLAKQSLSGTHRTVGLALASYQQVAADAHGRGVATVRVSRALSETDRQRLTDALSRQYNREIHLNVVVDPSVIGGIKVEIGDDVIDGTVASRLDEARRKLAG